MASERNVEILYNENDRQWDVVLRPDNVCIKSFYSRDDAEDYVRNPELAA